MRHRGLVLSAAGLLLVAGSLWTARLPLDVFPDVSAPTVTVVTEARGLAPEEVELLVTFPLESVINGAPGVRRVRSVSAAGIAVVWVEFDWGEDVYRARQVVSERLQAAELPASVDPPQLGPVSSVMGEITFIALTSTTVSPMELRLLAETVVRRTLLSVPGISQVVPIGGDVREYQVEADPIALAQRGITVDELAAAVEQASRTAAAGFHVDRGQEYLVRGLGRARGAADLAATVLRNENGVPLTVGQVAAVREGPEPKRGTASYQARPAVILSVQKQPEANTLALTREIDRLLEDFKLTRVRKSMGYMLSGGERRRVEIARALAISPSYILLDEPFAGIDPIAVLDIQGIIRHLKEMGIGVLITDHNVRETLKITSRAYIINNGGILRTGSPADLSADPQVRKIYLGDHFQL